jgi:thiol-disulfide isomerase/thioredoxin
MKARAPNTARTWALAAILGLLLVSWLLFHHQINHALAVQLFLHSNSPSEELFAELAAQSKDPADFLQRSWATGKIPHRQFVAAFLKNQAEANSPKLSRIEPLVLACAIDADTSVRELGLASLGAAHNPHMFEAARVQLDDPDPSVRLLGLEYLRRCDPKLAVPALVRLLDDPDLEIVTGAEVGLRRCSGEDYGVRMQMAIRTPEDVDSGQVNSNKISAIHQGIQKRKEWWRTHQNDYPVSSNLAPRSFGSGQVSRQPAADFALRDLSGKKISLSDFRGKVVLLNFWATWCTACLAEIPDLIALQNKLGDQVAIIGVALDGVADEHGDIPGEEAGEKSHKSEDSLKTISAKVERAVKLRGINYHILLDPTSSAGSRYNGGELPTTVIFDKEGRVRRRFIGERSLNVFEAMIADAGKPPGASRSAAVQSH